MANSNLPYNPGGLRSSPFTPVRISPAAAKKAQEWIARFPDFNTAAASAPWTPFVKESIPEFLDLAASIHSLLHRDKRFVLLDATKLLEYELSATKFLLIALSSCLGMPTATDPRHGLIAWEVAPRTDLPPGHRLTITENQAAAAPHTDSSYRLHPERYVALLVIRPAEEGAGLSEIVDGRRLIAMLLESPEGRKCERLLRTINFPFRVPDSFTRTENRAQGEVVFAPVLTDDPFIRFRYDSILEGFDVRPQAGSPEARWAIDYLLGVIKSAKDPVLSLQAGDLLLTNNHEILHGRTAFTSRKRLLLRVRIQ
jgi:TfdA family taurine catabolism dioxygenase TauD